MTRHSRQDAVDSGEFQQLLAATERLDQPFRLQCKFILYLGGRLGLRAGEIAHCRVSWVDFDRQMLTIPSQQPCESGDSGGVCGYCRKRARAAVDAGTYEALDDALRHRWQPKTRNSARTIPFGWSDEIATVLTTFFDHTDRYPSSRISINRRVDRVARAAGLDADAIYPHALRATAATHHAVNGLPPAALQAMMGWADLSTAVKYVRASGEQTRQALEQVYG